jgi:hypothetical protein
MSRSPFWERRARWLAWLVMFLERSKLAHVRYLLRRRRVRRVAARTRALAAGRGTSAAAAAAQPLRAES